MPPSCRPDPSLQPSVQAPECGELVVQPIIPALGLWLSPQLWVQDSGIVFHGQRRSLHDIIVAAAVISSPGPAVATAGVGGVWSDGG
jgi:hypothetical protein